MKLWMDQSKPNATEWDTVHPGISAIPRATFDQRAVIGVMDEESVERAEQRQKQHRARVKQQRYRRRTLHEVDAIFHQPMEAFQE